MLCAGKELDSYADVKESEARRLGAGSDAEFYAQ